MNPSQAKPSSIPMVKTLLNAAVWLGMLWVFTRFQLPGNSLFANALQNSGHGLAFFVLTILSMSSLRPSLQKILSSGLFLTLLLFLLGVVIELLQHLSGRGASLPDLVMNASGIVSGGITYYLIRAKLRWTVRLLLAAVAVSSIAWVLHKPAIYVFAELIERPPPMLNDFDAVGSGIKVLPRHAEINIGDHSRMWPTNLSKSVKVSFGQGDYPSIIFQEPPASWCDYDTFVFDVYSPLPEGVNLYIRIDDDSIDYLNHSFMTVRRMIEPGVGQVSIPFDEFANDASERGEPMFNEMSRYQLFTLNNDQSKVLYFDNFRLTKSDANTFLSCTD